MHSNPDKTPPLPSPTRGGILFLFFLSLLHLRKHFIVEGNSMSPLLESGDIVYTKKSQKIKVDDVVVLPHPFRNKYIIKQVTALHCEMLELSGLNPESSEDSRTFGYVPVSDVLGVVVAKKVPSHF